MINRTIVAAPAAVTADRSMRALEYIVAACALAAALVIGLAR